MQALGHGEPGQEDVSSTWCAWHLYGADTIRGLTQPLLHSVEPVVRELAEESWFDRFFFIRYSDHRGPHLRLRFRIPLGPGAAEKRAQAMEERLASTGLLVAKPFEPETTRYGGPSLLPASLDFFCLSSQAALETLRQMATKSRAQQLTATLRRLVHQAVGAARDRSDLLLLLDYFEAWRPAMQPVVEKADQVFDRAPNAHRRSVASSIQEARVLGEADLLVSGAASLARSLDRLEDAERLPILRSQMHMTANRLGLLNAEESYLTRIACRAAETLSAEELDLGLPTPKSDHELIHV